ncbi:MAG: MHYT domain-containing protein [Tepidimonas sp.]|uniref:MHYT domain-containing protein n=1 Tax=Tepidimonas sp. TaxID=2002775 RepID=UPI00259D63EB|nr:MHYT domain-containing protein [Tepidimonas sp.]MDM7455879.1 MHYT domain-containing protein [Tepidimonas sp.]
MGLSWSDWFAWRQDAGSAALVIYDPFLVTLSVLVACAGATAAMHLIGLASRADRLSRSVARSAYAVAAVTLGISVWGMHFIGMLATDFCQPVRYEPLGTALSMIPSIAASAIGLRIYLPASGGDAASAARRIAAGAWLGAGIGAMHYSGMQALRMESAVRYDPVGFAWSIAVAVILAILGLSAHTWLQRHTAWRAVTVHTLAGCLLGLAVSGMHYSAMQATLVLGPVDAEFERWSERPTQLALAVTAVLVVAIGFAWGMMGIWTYRALARRLREREGLLRDIIEHLPGAIVRVRAGGTFDRLLVSPSLADLTGRSLQAYERGEWSLLDLLAPEDRAKLEQLAPQVRGECFQTDLHARIRHATRGWRHLKVRVVLHPSRHAARAGDAQPVLDLFLQDVTVEHQALQRERQLQAAIDRLVGRAVLNPDGVFVEVNAQLAAWLGYQPEELRGQPHRIVWPEETDPTQLETFWAALRRGEAQPGEFARRTKDGRIVHISGWYQPLLDDGGHVYAVLKLVFDVTERVQALQRLQVATQQLEQALASRSAFFANVSHEIRTPMNAIVGFAELLHERLAADGELREPARAIRDAARGLLRILNDLLDAAKLEQGEFRLIPAPFRLDRLLHDLISQYGVLAARRGLSLRLQLDETLPLCWDGDADRIRQILANLLGNAIKFTERGRVDLGATQRDTLLLLWVEDTGIGIAPERQEAIFEPFVQADAGTARRYGGTGLGMSIVKRLVERMDGRIALSSVPAVGTRVEVTLPLTALPQQRCAAQEAPRADAPAAAHPSLRILAADDVEQNRTLLALLLQREGHQATIENDGAALLARYQSDPTAWDLVLLDLKMPVLDGWETCARLRAWERAQGRAPIPVWALSASIQDSDRAAAQRVGMDGFLEKPIDPDALRQALADAAARRQRCGQTAVEPAAPASCPPALTGAPLPDDGVGAVDPQRGMALWGADWMAQVHSWLTELAPRWSEAERWERAEWHRIAGTAANLALPALAQAARRLEASDPPYPADALQAAARAWQALQDWLASTASAPITPSPASSAVGGLPECRSAPQALLQRLQTASRHGEWDDAALQEFGKHCPEHAAALRAAWEAFDFEAAQRLLQRWLAPQSDDRSD